MKYYLILTLSIFLMGCSHLDSYQKSVTNAGKLKLYSVLRTPIEESRQIQGKLYISDFEVVDTISLSPEVEMLLKEALIEKDNYSEENLKRCPFMAKYAIHVNDSLSAIVATEPCSKIIIFSVEELQTFDLTKDNKLEGILNSLGQNQNNSE